MSLINLFLERDRALIAVDEESVDFRNGGFVSTSKMVHLQHANLVLAGRGIQFFLMLLFAEVGTPFGSDLDSTAEALPRMMKRAHDAFSRLPHPHVPDESFHAQEIVLVGWSPKASAMRAYLATIRDSSGYVHVETIDEPGIVIPWQDHWGEQPDVSSDLAGAGELMLQQVARIKAEAPHIPAGGALLAAELSKDRLQFWREPLSPAPKLAALHAPPRVQVFGQEAGKRKESLAAAASLLGGG